MHTKTARRITLQSKYRSLTKTRSLAPPEKGNKCFTHPVLLAEKNSSQKCFLGAALGSSPPHTVDTGVWDAV